MATVLKQSSNQGLRFMFFNKYKDLLTGTDGGGKLSPLLSLIGQATLPFQAVRVRVVIVFHSACSGFEYLQVE